MKIVNSKAPKTIAFKDLEEGGCFTEEGETQIQIKTDENSGCCLEDGVLGEMGESDKVVKVNCELVVK